MADALARLGEKISPSATDGRFATPGALAAFCTKGREWNAPHLELIDRALADAVEGRYRGVLVSMPPRHGKSQRISKWAPAWFLHRFPDKRVLLASYEHEFAAQWGRKVRDVVEHNDLGISVRQDSFSAARWDLDGHAGGMMTAGMGGPITGKGADLLIIDDPVKNSAEANSEVVRAAHWDWYLSTAFTRLEPGGAIFVVSTRWHEDDLAGRIARANPPGWLFINLPALAEDDDPIGRAPGEALWPARYDEAALSEIRQNLEGGSYWWSALYQGHPTPLEGGLFKKAWFQYWDAIGDGADLRYRLGDKILHPQKDGWTFATVDLASSTKTSADWTVVSSWFVTYTGDLVLLDRERARIDETQHWNLINRQKQLHNLSFVAVESRMFGSTVVYEMGRRGVQFRELKADVDKITRALPATVRCESGRLWWPRNKPWLGEWEAEHLSFPNATHDDCVDTTSYACLQLAKYGHGRRRRERHFPGTMEERFWESQRQDLDATRNPKFVGLE